METQLHKEILLRDPPKTMFGKAIMLSQWAPDYNYREASKHSKQIWVELQFVDPLLLKQGHNMLSTIVTVLYHTVTTSKDLKYAHILACLLRENLTNLPDSVIVDLPWGGHITQDVKYTFLPDTCFRCRQRGHMAADCTNTVPNRNGRFPPKTAARPNTASMPRSSNPSSKTVSPASSPSKPTQHSGTPSTQPMQDPDEGDKQPTQTQPLVAAALQIVLWDLNTTSITAEPPRTQQLSVLGNSPDQSQPPSKVQDSTSAWCQQTPSPEAMVIAKKRILETRQISPHEQVDQTRDFNARDNLIPRIQWGHPHSDVHFSQPPTRISEGIEDTAPDPTPDPS
ncbi:hypothetical protein R1sor_010974 [Riccia sorocarpa]|uniref:CCHC-type domain-containing protein n=1 Tax=Riccia sorocarpa TaxID=122646 RepID=A0ABD3HZK2_9MARC